MKIFENQGGLLKLVSWIIAVLWLAFIFFDYINKHPGYISSWEYFQYPKLYSFLLVFFLLITANLKWEKWKKWKIPVNGITLTIFSFILTFAMAAAHKDYALGPSDYSHVFSFLLTSWSVIGFLFLMIFIWSSAGRVIYRRLFKKYFNPSFLLDLALGIMAFILCLFVLGIFGAIKQNIIILLIFFFALFNLFYLVQTLKEFFLRKIDLSALNILGVLSFCVLVYYVLLNLMSSIGPYPSGFDSRNFYVNIAKLVSSSGYLVEGYQPYYWSLMMSIGFSLFAKVELALGLSYLGIILTLLAAFRLGLKQLNLDINVVLFSLCLFVVTPAVTNQMYTELKVDFAMLFYQILSLSYLFVLIKKLKKIDETLSVKENLRKIIPYVIMVGMLSSFALGIKMINMFMVFSILVIIWWSRKDLYATVGILSFSILLFLVAGIDDLSGLNKYHLSVGFLKILLLLMSLGGFVLSMLKFRLLSTAKTYVTIIYLACCGMFLLPWIVKNYIEIGKIEPRSLLMGKNPGPELGLNKMILNYENSKKPGN